MEFDVVFSHLVGVARIITAAKVVVTVTLAAAKFDQKFSVVRKNNRSTVQRLAVIQNRY